ncbi:MAG: hypothetical protein E7453_05120 [Ruminococcaceae bacterium]|nr:hypothetical protein [Oscillospiraceae bacterium]
MQIYIHVKKIGKRVQAVGTIPYEMETACATLRELISFIVTRSVAEYNRRLDKNRLDAPLGGAQLEDMAMVGKIGFGIPFGEKEANVQSALNVALEAFSDGLYRFFINAQEIKALDAPLNLQDGDTVAIIRLTMLTGGIF